MFKFLRGFSSLDIKTTRKMTRIVKETVWTHQDQSPLVIEKLLIQGTKSFFKTLDIRYCVTNPGERLRMSGSDTGKEIYKVVFNENNRKLHWVFIRGLKNEDTVNTIFYDTSSSDD